MSVTQQEAAEWVQLRLGLLSLLLWLFFTFGLLTYLGLQTINDHPALIVMAGCLGLAVAALPWLAYRRLVDWRQSRSQGPDPGGPRGRSPLG